MKKLFSFILLTATVSLSCAQIKQNVMHHNEVLYLLKENDQLSIQAIHGIQQIHTLKRIEQAYIAMLYHQNKINFQYAREMPLAIERFLWLLEDTRASINQQRNLHALYAITNLFQNHQCAQTRPTLYFTEEQLQYLREQNSSLRNTLKDIDTELNDDQKMLSYYERFLKQTA